MQQDDIGCNGVQYDVRCKLMQVYAGLDLKVPSPSPSFSLEHLEPAQAKVRGSMASTANLPTTTLTSTKNNSLLRASRLFASRQDLLTSPCCL